MPEIVFTIGGGKTEIEGKDFTGGACDAAIKEFLDQLGVQTSEKRKIEPVKVVQKQQVKI